MAICLVSELLVNDFAILGDEKELVMKEPQTPKIVYRPVKNRL